MSSSEDTTTNPPPIEVVVSPSDQDENRVSLVLSPRTLEQQDTQQPEAHEENGSESQAVDETVVANGNHVEQSSSQEAPNGHIDGGDAEEDAVSVIVTEADAANGEGSDNGRVETPPSPPTVTPPRVNKMPDPKSAEAQPKTNNAPDKVPDFYQDIEDGLASEISDKYTGSSPQVPVQLEWRSVRFDVKVKGRFPWSPKKDKTVLHPMSGYVQPGEVLAIMGPSGAGKTSLLNILAQRELNYTGYVRTNGKKLPSSFKNFSAFVEQDDVIHGNLTVRQALLYAAFLRLPTKMSIKEKLGRVREVIDILGLDLCENTKVGVPGGEKGISGGERKRVSIAMEMLKRPSLLFLDEPTSGMDAKTSLSIVKAIKNLARSGTTVIMTIHQPRSQILNYFDKLLLLADGQVAYHGETTQVDEYFTNMNPKFALPKGFNIADHVIDLITRTSSVGENVDDANLMAREEERIQGILDHWKEHHAHSTKTPPKLKYETDLKKFPRYSSNIFTQFFVLFFRNLNNIIMDRMVTVGKTFQSLVMVLFMGSLYFQMDNNQSTMQDRMGLMFFAMLSQVMSSLFNVLHTFPDEYKIFKRENASRAYSVGSYYFAKVLADVPHQIIFPLMFGVPLYWAVGFQSDAGRFFTFLLILIVVRNTGISLGEVISVLVPHAELALLIAPVCTIILVFFSGFYITVDSLPAPYLPIYYISLFNYGFEALVINEFDGLKLYCKPDEYVNAASGKVCPITNGIDRVKALGMDTEYKYVWINIGILCGMILVLKTLGFLILVARTNNFRSNLKRYLRNKREASMDPSLSSASLDRSMDDLHPHTDE